MSKLKLISLVIVMVLGISAVHAQETEAKVAVTLERTPCFGSCPVYTVTIMDNGDVIYNGGDFVTTTGEQTWTIEPETVATLVKAFEDAGYFDWNEEYNTQTVSDLPSAITSVTKDGVTHKIVHYGGDYSAPLALSYLEQWIDLVVNTAMWTGAQTSLTGISNGTSTPVATIQLDPCFGMCPVYRAALYPDGTLAYIGIANVPNLGVHIYQVETFNVDMIVQQAQALGYFGWQDTYDFMAMTDQATITTSVQTADNFKQIVRYGGDPNAPVGLTWVEETIERVVNEATGS